MYACVIMCWEGACARACETIHIAHTCEWKHVCVDWSSLDDPGLDNILDYLAFEHAGVTVVLSGTHNFHVQGRSFVFGRERGFQLQAGIFISWWLTPWAGDIRRVNWLLGVRGFCCFGLCCFLLVGRVFIFEFFGYYVLVHTQKHKEYTYLMYWWLISYFFLTFFLLLMLMNEMSFFAAVEKSIFGLIRTKIWNVKLARYFHFCHITNYATAIMRERTWVSNWIGDLVGYFLHNDEVLVKAVETLLHTRKVRKVLAGKKPAHQFFRYHLSKLMSFVYARKQCRLRYCTWCLL